MLRSLVTNLWPEARLGVQRQPWRKRSLTTNVQQRDEPLRILFCGSEGFSIAALKALSKYQKSPGSNVLSIDVAARKDKPGGRGMKETRSPQIKLAAAQLGYRVHQFDTFTGWYLPEYEGTSNPYINLVVAVSFGLLVPPRILNSAKFGGLNVHPSMLPDLRGAAPINWTILRGYSHTGVTVQTLHPSKFDHGVVLAQTPQPGLAIPSPNDITAHELRLLLAPVGAEMLVNVIRDRLYLQPHREIKSQSSGTSTPYEGSAPKIVPSMKILDPYHDGLGMILRKNRAIPKLWAEAEVSTDRGKQRKRILCGPHLRPATMDDLPNIQTKHFADSIPIGLPFALIPETDDVYQSECPLFLKVADGSVLAILDLLVAGDRQRPAAAAAAHAKLFADPTSEGSHKLYRFHQGLVVPDIDH